MKSLIAIDVGTVRVGIAFASSLSSTATPLGTVNRAQGKAENQILRLISERQIGTLVYGMPRRADGSDSEQCDDVRRFVRRLQRRVDIAFEEWDEFGTSAEARERLGLSHKPHRDERARGTVDAEAAVIILEEFMASRTVEK